jgi:hypothetical protein
VRNVEKSGRVVHRLLTEALITIRAKVHLFSVLDEHAAARQSEVRQ